MGADMIEVAMPEIADIVSGGKNIKTAAKSVGTQTPGNNCVVVAGKGLQAEPFQQDL